MKKTLLSLFAAACMLLAFSSTSFAQPKKPVKVMSKTVPTNRGVNPHIKGEAPTTDKKVTKSRGTCTVYFDNYSGLYVKVYVDGYYMGTLSPYGSFTVYAADGYTEIYCISTGGTRDWEATGNCTGKYVYSLY